MRFLRRLLPRRPIQFTPLPPECLEQARELILTNSKNC